MPAVSTPHLLKRGDGFYFRRNIPRPLVSQFGCKTIKFSLKTKDRQIAKMRCRLLANTFDDLIRGLEHMPDISKEQVRQIVRDYFVREWQEANDTHWCIVRDNQLDLEDELADIQEGERQLRERLSRHQFSKDVKETALKLVDERGLAPSLSGEQISEVCDGIVRAMIQHRHILAAKLRGEPEKAYPTDPLFSSIEDPGLPDLQMTDPAENGSAQEKGGLGHAIEQYLNDMTFRKFGQKGIEDKRRSLNWAIELLGGPGRNVGSITPDEVRDVRNIIQRLPKSFTTKKEYKGKRLREIVEMPNIVPVDAETADLLPKFEPPGSRVLLSF